jgi:hypothetical protein
MKEEQFAVADFYMSKHKMMRVQYLITDEIQHCGQRLVHASLGDP